MKKVKPLRIIGKDFRNRPIQSSDTGSIPVNSNICTVDGYISRNKSLPNAKPEDDLPAYCPPKRSTPEGEDDTGAEWKHGDMSDFQAIVRDYQINDKYKKGDVNGVSES